MRLARRYLQQLVRGSRALPKNGMRLLRDVHDLEHPACRHYGAKGAKTQTSLIFGFHTAEVRPIAASRP